jgi:hypothetical protein
VDISKDSFDTIPHSALKPILERKGVSPPIGKMIVRMYKDVYTKIITKDNIGVDVRILREFKQGDPLSPLLFNLCTELLIEMIEEETSGINSNNNRKVPILAFVDDIVLLSGDETEAQRQVDILHEYLKSLGIKISREKSLTFQVVTKKDTWFVKNSTIRLNNDNIPAVDPDEAFRYLDAKMGPWKGVHCGVIVPEILSVVRKVRKLSLKPCQKLELVVNYIFPSCLYNLLISPPSDSVLKLLDSEVRQEIKAIFHLMSSTVTGFFYAPKSYGGLGVPNFEHIIKLGTFKNGIKMKESLGKLPTL